MFSFFVGIKKNQRVLRLDLGFDSSKGIFQFQETQLHSFQDVQIQGLTGRFMSFFRNQMPEESQEIVAVASLGKNTMLAVTPDVVFTASAMAGANGNNQRLRHYD